MQKVFLLFVAVIGFQAYGFFELPTATYTCKPFKRTFTSFSGDFENSDRRNMKVENDVTKATVTVGYPVIYESIQTSIQFPALAFSTAVGVSIINNDGIETHYLAPIGRFRSSNDPNFAVAPTLESSYALPVFQKIFVTDSLLNLEEKGEVRIRDARILMPNSGMFVTEYQLTDCVKR